MKKKIKDFFERHSPKKYKVFFSGCREGAVYLAIYVTKRKKSPNYIVKIGKKDNLKEELDAKVTYSNNNLLKSLLVRIKKESFYYIKNLDGYDYWFEFRKIKIYHKPF